MVNVLSFLLLFDCAGQEEQKKEESQVDVGCCRSLRLVCRSHWLVVVGLLGPNVAFALFLVFVCLYWKGWSCLQFPTFRFTLVLTRWLVFNIFSLLCHLSFFFLFVDEDFMDSCNFPYVLCAMPVFGVLSVNWGCGVCHVTSVLTVYVLYLLHLPSACLCLSSSVKPPWIHAITPTLESFCQLQDVVVFM